MLSTTTTHVFCHFDEVNRNLGHRHARTMRGFRFASLRWFVTCGLMLSVVFIGLLCFKNAGFFVSSNGLNLGGSEIQGKTTPSPNNSFLTVGQPNKDGSKKLETVQAIPKNFCEKYPKTLLGELSIDILEIFSNSLTDDETRNMEIGGSWKPSDCTPQERVAFIIPFRERPKQLQVFLNHMHRVLQRQKLYYRIFITEQVKFSFIFLFVINICLDVECRIPLWLLK